MQERMDSEAELSLFSLSHELIIFIFSYLSVKDLASLLYVNSFTNKLVQDHSLWRHKVKELKSKIPRIMVCGVDFFSKNHRSEENSHKKKKIDYFGKYKNLWEKQRYSSIKEEEVEAIFHWLIAGDLEQIQQTITSFAQIVKVISRTDTLGNTFPSLALKMNKQIILDDFFRFFLKELKIYPQLKYYLLHFAVALNQVESVNRLIAIGSDVNFCAKPKLSMDIIDMRVIIEDKYDQYFLLQPDGKIEIFDEPKQESCLKNLSCRQDIDIFTHIPLYTAVYHNNIELVKVLLQANSKVELDSLFESDLAEDNKEISPLTLAIMKNNLAMTELIIDLGKVNLNPDVFDNPSVSVPLHNAVACGDLGIVKMLLQKGAKVNGLDARDLNVYVTPLYDAVCYYGDTNLRNALVNELISHGADVNAAEQGGLNLTIMHMAAAYADVSLIKLLVELGGIIDISDNEAEIPLKFAIDYNETENAIFLMKTAIQLLDLKLPSDHKNPLDFIYSVLEWCESDKETLRERLHYDLYKIDGLVLDVSLKEEIFQGVTLTNSTYHQQLVALRENNHHNNTAFINKLILVAKNIAMGRNKETVERFINSAIHFVQKRIYCNTTELANVLLRLSQSNDMIQLYDQQDKAFSLFFEQENDAVNVDNLINLVEFRDVCLKAEEEINDVSDCIKETSFSR